MLNQTLTFFFYLVVVVVAVVVVVLYVPFNVWALLGMYAFEGAPLGSPGPPMLAVGGGGEDF